MIISMAWTTAAFLAGRKRCTRRNWAPDYARRWKVGQTHDVWDRSPRTGAGKPIGKLRVTQAPVYEPLANMPDRDFEAEGFAFFEEHPELLTMPGGVVGGWDAFVRWRNSGESLWTVRFEPVAIYHQA